ncbi:uncharacterized protein LOC124285714 [Haliotis rubra]|uniref:uncharacterized protein LOC124285714 n=1 Tax=Haliotis rubra TaxID=36100 RepID=UPI001EE5380D|nr:uncharacterized protein LOC124285714 [Haliotis rubra]
MKLVLCFVLLPVLVLSSPSFKGRLLELLEKMERRQLEDTTPYNEGTTYQVDTTEPPSTEFDTEMTTTYDVDTSTVVNPDATSDAIEDDMATPVYDMASTTLTHEDAKDMTTPCASEMAPREYVRQATEGVCMLLSFVKGQEQLRKVFGNNGGPSLMTSPDGGLPTLPYPMKRLLNLDGPKPVQPAPMGGNPDRSAPKGMLPKHHTDKSFPWEEAEQKLQDLCQLINSYSSEPLQLAEKLVQQMGAHMGR